MTPRFLLFLTAALAVPAQVTFERLVRADREPHNWLNYSGSYRSHRYSPLDQITRDNIKNLRIDWIYQARSLERFEATPLVVNGIMYVTQAPNDVIALDASTGRRFWTYSHAPLPAARGCCGKINRGVAILGDRLFMGTMDARLIAIDAKSGRSLWNVGIADPNAGYSITHAPLVIKDKVIVGVAGGEYGIRGFIAAYEIASGKEAWRFYTVPGPGEPGNETWAGDSWKTGGAPIWITGSYDPELNLTYWGTGNPGPDYNSDKRAGDNLYSNSVIALNPDTGKLQWHFQFTPHDELDYDATQIPVLVDAEWRGRPRKLMMWANRNGFFYVLDRVNGEFLMGKPFAKVTWATGLDDKGRPVKSTKMSPNAEGVQIFPGALGATNYYAPSYSSRTGLFYVSTWVNTYNVFTKFSQEYEAGKQFLGGLPRGGRTGTGGPQEEDPYGAVRALDPKTGEMKWEFKMTTLTTSGLLTTASDLLFTGGLEGYIFALDARNGAMLWKSTVGGLTYASPMSYQAGGKQYVAIAAGNALFAFALAD